MNPKRNFDLELGTFNSFVGWQINCVSTFKLNELYEMNMKKKCFELANTVIQAL